MALRIYTDDFIPKYQNGKWIWNEKDSRFKFVQLGLARAPDYEIKAPKLKFGVQFKDSLSQVEEIIFRKKFTRTDNSRDNDVITLQDIKNIVLFIAPTKNTSHLFIDMFHTSTVNQFLNDLIIYFEFFIKVVEYLLIRRDELYKQEKKKVRNMDSVAVEKILSEYLSQYRLILAREYSKITIGQTDTKFYHHRANKMLISMTEKDRILFETFLCCCSRVVYIAMHRRAFSVIDYEINRLFRSPHFNVTEKQLPDCIKFSKREEEILYGINDIRVNCRNQKSPLILEILRVTPKNVNVLWIGEHKYRGNDPRMKQLELEYVTPDSQLSFVDVQHGILGHPKSLYDTLLNLDWSAVRKQNFNENYDPYRLIRRPFIQIPKWENYLKQYEHKPPFFQFNNTLKYDIEMIKNSRHVWKNRDKIFSSEIMKIFPELYEEITIENNEK